MIFRIGILVVASLATFAVSPVNRKRLKKQYILLSAKDCSSSEEMDRGREKFGDNIPEDDTQEEEETKVVNGKNVEKVLKPNLTQKTIFKKLELDSECKFGNTEIEHSQNLIKDSETRRVNLEGKLLELYILKEKLSYIASLQRNLDGKTAEIDQLNFTIFALKAEMKDLQEITSQGSLAMTQLEMAKKVIEEMQMKNGNASQIKGQIVVLEEQLSGFTANQASPRDPLVKKRLEAVKNIELQLLEMRRRNKELELEKRELLVKLYAAHAQISALSDMTESKTIAKISELRHANADLSKEVARLQKSRFDMVEELVYQRWLNACLKAEMQYHQTSSRKTLQKELQKASDHKPRKITTQYPDMNSISSSYTLSTDSEEIDSSIIESSSSSQRSISKNSGTGHCTSWRRSMDGSSVVSSPAKSSRGSPLERTGIIRRFSTLIVTSKTSMLSTKLDGTSSKKNVPVLKDSTETMETPNLTKVGRVSFNDAVETVPSAKIVLTKSVEGVLDDKEIVTLVSGHRSRMKAGMQAQSALSGEKLEFPLSEVSMAKPDRSSDSNRRSVDEDDRDAQEVSWIENARPEGRLHSSISNVNKMDTLIKPLVFAFFFFLFVLLLYFLHLSARIY